MLKYLSTFTLAVFAFIFTHSSCTPETTTDNGNGSSDEIEIIIPNMNKDSVYSFVQQQVDFGPRVPGSQAHKKCSQWFKKKLESYGANVIMQEFKAKFHFGAQTDAVNIIAQINPKHKRRVMLCAHWDSRRVADEDTERKNEAILGADDGGSGVAVLIEIARLIKENPIDLGIDIILFDAEDQGESSDEDPNSINTWCLGSQYWSRKPHVAGYWANFGILLDMVGSQNARFSKEGTSMSYAETTMNKVWKLAQEMGYGNYFVDDRTPGVVDDHYFINSILKTVPTIDIINRTKENQFGKYWHTHDDDMDVISKRSLAATGNVVLAVLYNEAKGVF